MLVKILGIYFWMVMTNLYDKDVYFLEEKAANTGFIRDTLEKVYRLLDILIFINSHNFLSDILVLKGGTAINLTVFNLPRLSVDIDLDFHKACGREEMLASREVIRKILCEYMKSGGYVIDSDKGKNVHSLDSFVFFYRNSGGNKDNIKIEINYSMRSHIFAPCRKPIIQTLADQDCRIMSLNTVELFGSKIKALLERNAPRDLYDIYNLVRLKPVPKESMNMLKKSVLFYKAVGCTGEFNQIISYEEIKNLSFQKIRQSLIPVLNKVEKINLEIMKSEVCLFLDELLAITESEKNFLYEFSKGNYIPRLLFDDEDIIKNIEHHPMAIWKCQKIKNNT